MKPAGAQADFRSVAAMLAIKSTAGQNFRGLTGAWVGSLLQEGGIYRRRDGQYFLSLGSVASPGDWRCLVPMRKCCVGVAACAGWVPHEFGSTDCNVALLLLLP